MKIISQFRLLLLLFVFVQCTGKATPEAKNTTVSTLSAPQPKQYVTWKTSLKKISADEYDLVFIASIEPGWHLYSQIETPDGPLATIFEFEKSQNLNIQFSYSPKIRLTWE